MSADTKQELLIKHWNNDGKDKIKWSWFIPNNFLVLRCKSNFFPSLKAHLVGNFTLELFSEILSLSTTTWKVVVVRWVLVYSHK